MTVTRRLLLILIGLLCFGSTTADLPAADWPQWRGPDRNGISKETGLLKSWPQDGPAELWSVTTEGEGYAAPAVVGDRIYVTGSKDGESGREGVLYAIDTGGKIVWERSYGPEWGTSYPNSRTTPTIDGDVGYLFSGAGVAVCFDAKTGKKKWSVDTLSRFNGANIRWGIAESPLLVGNTMICHPGGPDAAVVALDKATGKTVWTSKGLGEKSAYCSPGLTTIGSCKLIVTQTEKNIVGLDADKGTVLWKVAQQNKYAVHPNTPVFFDDNVFISSGYDYGSQLLKLAPDGAKATVTWQTKEADIQFHGAIYVDGRLYGSQSNGRLVCLDPANGTIVYKVSEVRKAAILYADGRLYAYDEKGGKVSLVNVRPDGYEMAGSFKVDQGKGPHWAHPVVANGTLYIRHGKTLIAYDIKAK